MAKRKSTKGQTTIYKTYQMLCKFAVTCEKTNVFKSKYFTISRTAQPTCATSGTGRTFQFGAHVVTPWF
jgi:hypothetical protein